MFGEHGCHVVSANLSLQNSAVIVNKINQCISYTFQST